MQQGYIRAVVAEDNSLDNTKFMLVPRVSQYVLDENGEATGEETDEYKRWTQVRRIISSVMTRVAKNGLEIHRYEGVPVQDRPHRPFGERQHQGRALPGQRIGQP